MSREDLKTYGSSEVVLRLRISVRQLNYWVDELKVVEPYLKQCGRKFYRRFSEEHIVVLTKMRNLVKQGYLSRIAAKQLSEEDSYRNSLIPPLSSSILKKPSYGETARDFL